MFLLLSENAKGVAQSKKTNQQDYFQSHYIHVLIVPADSLNVQTGRSPLKITKSALERKQHILHGQTELIPPRSTRIICSHRNPYRNISS